MDIEFAGNNENQSGQRFLDSSAPRLIRHVGSCETAGGDDAPLVWDTYPLPAGKDKKLSRVFEGSALISAAGTVPSSLDSLENNRNTSSGIPDYNARPKGRGTFCGRYSVTGIDPKTGRRVFRRINCGGWTCSYCGPRRARTAKASIRQWAEDLQLKYFLTLTLDPSKLEGGMCEAEFAVQYMRKVFNKFRVYLRRQYGEPPNYICVLEFTQAGVPHLHILIDRYIPQAWISNVWASLGGGRVCFIKQVKVKHVARYLSKYLTKDLLLSAPKGTRRITCARSIKLFPKFVSDMTWELLKSSIWWNMAECRCRLGNRQEHLFRYITFDVDEQRFLKYFEVVSDIDFFPEKEPAALCAL
jgi:hypothetical protein